MRPYGSRRSWQRRAPGWVTTPAIQQAVDQKLMDERDRQATLKYILALHDADTGAFKRTWGAFASTDIEKQLRARGVTQVVVAGVATGTGVESTARQAYEAGFNVTLAIDAMTDARPNAHDYSIEQVFPRLGETGSTQAIIDLLERTIAHELA